MFMTNIDSISEVSALWAKRSNCAQSTGKGLLEHFKYSEAGDVLFSSFIPYGGGFMSGNVCGAVSGTLAATSYILWKEKGDMMEVFQLTNQIKEKFVNEFGSISCIKILSPILGTENLNTEDLNMEELLMKNISMDDPEIYKSDLYKLCTSCVNRASLIAKEVIEKAI